MEVQPYYIAKINLALWRVLDMKVLESAAFRKRNPSAELRFARTSHTVSRNQTVAKKTKSKKFDLVFYW